MQIIQLYSGQDTSTGDFVYRIEHPAMGLAKLNCVEVHNIDLLRIRNWNLIIEAPLLILHHLSDPDLLPVITARQRLGLPTIYELADNFKVSYLHKPDALKTGAPDYHCIMAQLVRRCDAVQTPSIALKERFKTENSRFFVFPNLIEA